MKKEELIELITNVHKEDTSGKMSGIFIGRHGEIINCESIRIDMDGGRVIIVQQGSGQEEVNDRNWQQELEFTRNKTA